MPRPVRAIELGRHRADGAGQPCSCSHRRFAQAGSPCRHAVAALGASRRWVSAFAGMTKSAVGFSRSQDDEVGSRPLPSWSADVERTRAVLPRPARRIAPRPLPECSEHRVAGVRLSSRDVRRAVGLGPALAGTNVLSRAASRPSFSRKWSAVPALELCHDGPPRRSQLADLARTVVDEQARDRRRVETRGFRPLPAAPPTARRARSCRRRARSRVRPTRWSRAGARS